MTMIATGGRTFTSTSPNAESVDLAGGQKSAKRPLSQQSRWNIHRRHQAGRAERRLKMGHRSRFWRLRRRCWDDLFVAPLDLDDSTMKTSFDYFDHKAKHHFYFGGKLFPVAPARAIILSSNSLEIPQTLIAFFCATCSPPQAGKRYSRSKPQT